MRILAAVVSALPALHSSAASQTWEVVDSPVKDNITGICSVAPNTLVLITDQGDCARSDDGGRSWKVFEVAAKIHLEGVSFADSMLGVVCGRGGALYRTIDGGASWESRSLKDTVPWFTDIEMFDARTGLVIGITRDSALPFGGLMLRTSDGGRTWHEGAPFGMGYSEITYRPGGQVHLLAFGLLNYSNDLGKNWKWVKTIDALARTVSILGKTGILAGPNGLCAFSSDSGKTWTRLNRSSDKMYIAAEMIDEKVGYIGGAKNSIMRTADGGRTWNDEVMARAFNVLDMCLLGDRLFAVGSEGGIIAKRVK